MCELPGEEAEWLNINDITFGICDGYLKLLSDADFGWSELGETFWTEDKLEEGIAFENDKPHWREMEGTYEQQNDSDYIANVMYFSVDKISETPYLSIATYRGGEDIEETELSVISDNQLFYFNGGLYSFDLFVIDENTFEIKNVSWVPSSIGGIYKKSSY